jgi:hypothetical protein
MSIDEAVAKIRTQTSSFEPAENQGHPVWAGEVQIETRIGRAIPYPTLGAEVERSPELEWYREGARLDSTLLEIRRRGGRSKP